jgi:hypothetical protein
MDSHCLSVLEEKEALSRAVGTLGTHLGKAALPRKWIQSLRAPFGLLWVIRTLLEDSDGDEGHSAFQKRDHRRKRE